MPEENAMNPLDGKKISQTTEYQIEAHSVKKDWWMGYQSDDIKDE